MNTTPAPATQSKSNSLIHKIIKEIEDTEVVGHWELTEQEKSNIDTLLSLSNRYDDYYLNGHGYYLGRHLKILKGVIFEGLVTGKKLYPHHKKSYEIVCEKMRTHLADVINPRFVPGDAVFPHLGQTIGLVVSGPHIDAKDGRIKYEIFDDMTKKMFDQDTLKKKAKFKEG